MNIKKIISKVFYSLVIWILSLRIFYAVEKLYRPMTGIQTSQRQFEDSYESYRYILYNSMIWNNAVSFIIVTNILICLFIFRKEIKALFNKIQ